MTPQISEILASPETIKALVAAVRKVFPPAELVAILGLDAALSVAPVRILRMPQVEDRTGLSRSALYELMDEDGDYFDPTFPKRRQVTKKTVGLIESELESWIVSRPPVSSSKELQKSDQRNRITVLNQQGSA